MFLYFYLEVEINWWDYKIGAALELNEINMLMYDEISTLQRLAYANAVHHFTSDFVDRYSNKKAIISFTAANRVWISMVICQHGIIMKNSERITFGRDSLASVFQYSKDGDGFYEDGSFIQHVKFPYTGGYGVSLLTWLSEGIFLLSGSKWAVDPSHLQLLYRWINENYEPIIYKGNVMSMVEGREISRRDAQGDRKGVLVIKAIALLATVADPTNAAQLRGILQYWLAENPVKKEYLEALSLTYRRLISEVQEAKVTQFTRRPYLYKQFPAMDRAIQRTPTYTFGISMHSLRIYNYETRTDYENIKGWHTGDGQTYLYNNDLDQFNNDFWATVDYYGLPGTTVENQTKVAGYKSSKSSWVGGAAILGRYGLTGMDVAPVLRSYRAKKSWFMLDGKIVALGAGITTQDSISLNTYIEQRRLTLKNENTIIINGETMPQVFGEKNNPLVINNVKWAHISGNVAGADIGYYFPEGISLNAARGGQTGAWGETNVNYNNTRITQPYVTFWKSHGTPTVGDDYAYVILPGYDATATKAYAASPDFTIISNTVNVQAIKSESLNLIAANFWQRSYQSLNLNGKEAYLSCSGEASVLVKKDQGKMVVAVSDPTMSGKNLLITLKEKAKKVTFSNPAITVVTTSPSVKLLVNVVGLKGATVNIELATN